MSKRVNVTIPKEVETLFNWTVKYDLEFKGNEASIVAHYFAKGMQAAYEESLKNADNVYFSNSEETIKYDTKK